MTFRIPTTPGQIKLRWWANGFGFDLYRFDTTRNKSERIGSYAPLADSDMVATATGELALFNNDGLHLVDVESGRANTIHAPPVVIAQDITLAPEGFYISDRIQGTGLVTISGEFEGISDNSFDFVAADLAGNLFAATNSFANEIIQIDIDTGDETFAVSIDAFSVIYDLEIDANGNFVVLGIAEQNRGVFSIDRETGVITELAPELTALFMGDLTIVRDFSTIPEPNVLALLAATSLVVTIRRKRRQRISF